MKKISYCMLAIVWAFFIAYTVLVIACIGYGAVSQARSLNI